MISRILSYIICIVAYACIVASVVYPESLYIQYFKNYLILYEWLIAISAIFVGLMAALFHVSFDKIAKAAVEQSERSPDQLDLFLTSNTMAMSKFASIWRITIDIPMLLFIGVAYGDASLFFWELLPIGAAISLSKNMRGMISILSSHRGVR